jgi:hypothetical protein
VYWYVTTDVMTDTGTTVVTDGADFQCIKLECCQLSTWAPPLLGVMGGDLCLGARLLPRPELAQLAALHLPEALPGSSKRFSGALLMSWCTDSEPLC